MKTRTTTQTLILVATALLCVAACETSRSQTSTAFTYSGHLSQAGQPANQPHDLTFRLFTTALGGSPVAAVTNANVAVSNGVFITSVDFGPGFFDGTDYWLELGVRPRGTSLAFNILDPRQPITRIPYAFWASQAAEAASAQTAAAVAAGAVSRDGLANGAVTTEKIFDGTIALSDLSASAQNAFWRLDGNAGTTAGTHFLGTTDDQPLELKVNNRRVLRLEPTIGNGAVNLIVGQLNTVGSNAAASTLSGGWVNAIQAHASSATLAGGQNNTIQSDISGATISGGSFNTIEPLAHHALISGGYRNLVQSNDWGATIGGGAQNTIQAEAESATLGGGSGNTIREGARYATVGGGYSNTLAAYAGTLGGGQDNAIENSAVYATLAGGNANQIQAYSPWSTVGGGVYNTVQSNAQFATIGGGRSNRVGAFSATIPGGRDNVANGAYSLASGRRAQANHTGAFVWADSTDADFLSVSNNEFAVRAAGGVRLETGGAGLKVDGNPVVAGLVQPGQIATGAVANSALADNAVTTEKIFDGTIALSDLSASAQNAFWRVDGNAGTTPGLHFLGTTDNQPLELKVNGLRAARLEFAGDSAEDAGSLPDGAPNVILGAPVNFVATGAVGAAIAGGGATNYGGFAYPNSILSSYGAIGGGLGNRIAPGAILSAIGGGYDNTIAANSYDSTIGGGYRNGIGTNSHASTIAGGYGNAVGFNSEYSAIGGGDNNIIAANSLESAIGGGRGNNIGTNSYFSIIGGGYSNNIGANSYLSIIGGGWCNAIGFGSEHSTIGGGWNNNIGTNSANSTIAGGYGNGIGTNSVLSAIGGGYSNNIAANSYHSTIGGGWDNNIGDNSDGSTIAGGEENDIGASAWLSTIGGGANNKIAANGAYATIPGGRLNAATNYAFAAGYNARATNTGAFVWSDGTGTLTGSTNNNSVTMRASGGYRFFTSTGTAGAYLAPGGGSWTSLSDRNAKENLEAVNARAVLERVTALPLSTWNYKSQDARVRHIGPMAQDFKAAFALGESDTGITTVDADGVALAAIQGLNLKLEERLKAKGAQLEELTKRNESLEKRLEKLEERLSTLAQSGGGP